ncbi:PspC domain-containing protein [Corynebacterium qintianiae]|uniref:PspC domain-containing protein n=1 Tax=Corynebacterium qintianiae TaxID=2709392 RepID=A0A7T0KN60_9CORY|nr:PspC domain-containing protein [Corynebacterium qintianiae]QPK83602.1 PspC domain-containing protein [Corynebacterium qintianiae]
MSPITAYAPGRSRPYPRFARYRSGRIVAGCAAGLAAHLGVDVKWVRVFFALASFASGLGLILYAMLWVFTPLEKGEGTGAQGDWPRAVYVLLAAVGLAGSIMSMSLVSGAGGAFAFILGVVAVGAVVAWQAYDRGMSSASNVVALALGIVLVMGGVLAIALLGDNAGTAGIVVAVLASMFGFSLLVIPLIVRLASSLVEERQAKAVADQRAEIASRLHDSVLQTLALIQKRAGDADEVARLARGQERELRSWLFSAEDKADERATSTVFVALNKAAGEVEDLFGVVIRPVSVGEDVAFTEATEPVVLAAREAMMNSAKHAGVDSLDVYAENLAGELSVFVRDRGSGFDPAAVPVDRHGVRDSIVGRMERSGGSAVIRSSRSEGTEVELRKPL